MGKRVQEIYDYQVHPNYVENKLAELEDRSRRNNLRIDGVPEENGETLETCEKKVLEIIKEKLKYDKEFAIDCAHRTGGERKRNDGNQN